MMKLHIAAKSCVTRFGGFTGQLKNLLMIIIITGIIHSILVNKSEEEEIKIQFSSIK